MESEELGKAALQVKVKENDLRITLTKLSGKSGVLKNFLRLESDSVKSLYAVCKTCKSLVKYTSDSGTSGLQRHTCESGGERQLTITSFVKRKVPVAVMS
ncbi:hypothetical protein ABVT39_006786 [Epinephelus coioides]